MSEEQPLLIRDSWARRQVAKVGVPEGHSEYAKMLDAARSGWSALRIAQVWGAPEALIERLRADRT